VRLEVPWPLLRTIGLPPARLGSRLRWHDSPARLTLARLILCPAEQAAIEPGGAVVLADSMRAGWISWLHQVGEAPEQGLAVRLPGPMPMPAAVSLEAADADSPPLAPQVCAGDQACEVRLALPGLLPPSLLAGWHDLVPFLGALA